LQGSTRLVILQLVSERDRYGYEIIAAIRDRTNGALEVALAEAGSDKLAETVVVRA
jgi:DNA-binding PadR family transcriptional regulator